MADIVYRGNLKAASFPFLSELFGRSVIMKGPDQNYIGGLAAKESLDSAIGVPQIYYCHNVVPIDNGYKSVGYSTYAPAAFPSTARFGQVVNLRDDQGNAAQITSGISGNVYVMERGSTTWVVPGGAPIVPGKRITAAYVSGLTYIYFAGVGCYTYDWGTASLIPVTLLGLTASDVLGIVGNSGYLIAYSINAIAWSSTADPTDFVPDLTTGAGGGSVEGIDGNIVTAEEVYGGLIIFAERNAVAGVYSGNARYPYQFTAITGSGGLTSPNHTAQDVGSGSIYAYTTSGMQILNLKSAAAVFPEATDFLSGSLLEDFNELTNEFITETVSGQELLKHIAYIAGRYLVISYGSDALTHALIYDAAYKQFGRLRVDHTDCFEFFNYPVGTAEIPKKSIGFITANGEIKILNTDIEFSGSYGVLILGKFQHMRSRVITMQGVELENVNPGATFDLILFPCLDGKTFEEAVPGYLDGNSGKTRRYRFRKTALNHSILWKGNFTAVSFVLTYTVHGAR